MPVPPSRQVSVTTGDHMIQKHVEGGMPAKGTWYWRQVVRESNMMRSPQGLKSGCL
jgi:hypothetical protein